MTSFIRFARGLVRSRRAQWQKRAWLRGGAAAEIPREAWPESVRDPTGFYQKCFCYFHTRLPAELRGHRDYFTREGRGFGEDAFHVMWYLLFREFKPRAFLEIGVYRGQVLSLAAALQRMFGCEGGVTGISPFTPAGDSVSRYRADVNYLEDTLKNFGRFDLPKPDLLKAFSTDAAAREVIAGRRWDCIYIDGNHDYDVAKADWEACSRSVGIGGLIVLDDAGLTTAYRAPAFATGGHPGPSRLATEIDRAQFREILQVGHNRVFQKIA